ncbi:MAG: glycosyltransferase family 2 protein, partial [Leeuwenhoekiella sp.]
MEQELVSVIMPLYNAERFVETAIKSVQEQTYTQWELIIIDDASTDSSYAIAEKTIQDKRIRLLKLTKNNGAGIARNVGIRAAKGAYIAFLDADDLWKPQKIEKQIEFMKKKGVK